MVNKKNSELLVPWECTWCVTKIILLKLHGSKPDLYWYINLQKFYTKDKFRLQIDLHSMTNYLGYAMHGSSTCLVSTTDKVQLEIKWSTKGSGTVNCHIFVISDSQFKIQERARICSIKLMGPSKIPFNTLIVGPTNSGKMQFLMNQLCGPLRGMPGRWHSLDCKKGC